jgi:primosomal replication protein N
MVPKKEKPMLRKMLPMVLAGLFVTTPIVAWAQSDIDHAALAAQYEQEAKTARDKAQAHREMEKQYGGVQYSKVNHVAGMKNHCKRLIASYEAAAADADALAKEHREAAAKH